MALLDMKRQTLTWLHKVFWLLKVSKIKLPHSFEDGLQVNIIFCVEGPKPSSQPEKKEKTSS